MAIGSVRVVHVAANVDFSRTYWLQGFDDERWPDGISAEHRRSAAKAQLELREMVAAGRYVRDVY